MPPKYPYIARGRQRYRIARSKTFNIDNGSGTTDDDVIFGGLASEVEIISIKPIYVEATDSSGAASANWKAGTTAAGGEIVAATALAVSKSVGDVGTAGTLVTNRLAAGASLFARHTGVATTEAGQYYLQVEYQVAP